MLISKNVFAFVLALPFRDGIREPLQPYNENATKSACLLDFLCPFLARRIV